MLGKGEEKPPEMQFNKSKVEQHRPCFNLFNSFSIPLLVQIARPCETAHGSWAPDLSLLSREINSVLLHSGRAEWTSLPQGEEKPHRNEDFFHLLFLLVLPHLCHPWTFFQKASLFLFHPQGNLHLAAALKSCFSPHTATVAYPGKPGTEGAWDKRKSSILAHGNWVNELSRARGTMVSWVATDHWLVSGHWPCSSRFGSVIQNLQCAFCLPPAMRSLACTGSNSLLFNKATQKKLLWVFYFRK